MGYQANEPSSQYQPQGWAGQQSQYQPPTAPSWSAPSRGGQYSPWGGQDPNRGVIGGNMGWGGFTPQPGAAPGQGGGAMDYLNPTEAAGPTETTGTVEESYMNNPTTAPGSLGQQLGQRRGLGRQMQMSNFLRGLMGGGQSPFGQGYSPWAGRLSPSTTPPATGEVAGNYAGQLQMLQQPANATSPAQMMSPEQRLGPYAQQQSAYMQTAAAPQGQAAQRSYQLGG